MGGRLWWHGAPVQHPTHGPCCPQGSTLARDLPRSLLPIPQVLVTWEVVNFTEKVASAHFHEDFCAHTLQKVLEDRWRQVSRETRAWGCDPHLTGVTCRLVGTAPPILRTGTQERRGQRDKAAEAEGGLLHTGEVRRGGAREAGTGQEVNSALGPPREAAAFCPSSMKLIWTYNL